MRPQSLCAFFHFMLAVLCLTAWAKVPAGMGPARSRPTSDTHGLKLVSGRQSMRLFAPDRYIVEFARPKSTGSGQTGIQSVLSSVLSEFQSVFGHVTHALTFDSPVFYGASFKIQSKGHSPDDIKQLARGHPSVLSIRQARIFHPTSSRSRRHHSRATQNHHRDVIAQHAPHHPGNAGHGHDGQVQPDAWGINVITGIKQQHDLGNYGQGINVCISDTGVDSANPAINGGKPLRQECFGPGCPIVKGIDFIGDNYDGVNYHEGPMKSSSVRGNEECSHGTYTVGHILSNDSTLGIVGSAPGASVTAYRMAPCSLAPGVPSGYVGEAPEDLILKTFTSSVNDKCSVLSFSFGAVGGWAAELESKTINRIWDAGVLPVISAGNDGDYGTYTVNCPGCVEKTIAVASSDLLDYPGWVATVNPPLPSGEDLIIPGAYSPTSNKTWARNDVPVWFTPAARNSSSVEYDGCDPIAEDLSGQAAIFFRGGCLLRQKIGNAFNASALYAIIISDDHDVVYLPDSKKIYQVMITQKQGLELYSVYKNSSAGVKLSFGNLNEFKLGLQPNTANGGLISAYSSWGPDWDSVIKPDIVAPGGHLPSLRPLPDLYGIISGTSGAAPFFAGAAAVFQQVKGLQASPPEVVRRAFLHTAQPLVSAFNNSRFTSVFRQGHGLMNLTAAIELTSTAEPFRIFTGDTPRANLTQVITITNEGASAQDYTSRHAAAQSVFALHKRNGDGSYEDPTDGAFLTKPEETDAAGSVTITPSTFTLESGASIQITVDVQPPAPSDRMVLYSGWLFFEGSVPGGSLSVPYAGIGGDLASIPAFVSQFGVFNTTTPALYNSDLDEQIRNDTTVWTLQDDDYPVLAWQHQVGTRYYQCDLVDAGISFKATQAILDDPECCTSQLGEGMAQRQAVELQTLGQLGNFSFLPRDYVAGGDPQDTYFSECGIARVEDASGQRKKIPPGKYRVLLRVQKLFATTFGPDDYSSYLSHAFEVGT